MLPPTPFDEPEEDDRGSEALDRLLARLGGPETPGALAELAAAAATGTLTRTEQARWARLNERAADSPLLQERLSAATARVHALQAAQEDPMQRFRRLTGASAGPPRPLPQRVDRAPQASGRPRPHRWGRALVAASVVLIGLLVAARLLTPTDPYAFTAADLRVEGSGALRGGVQEEPELDRRYGAAMEALRDAQRSWLGVPRAPDPVKMAQAVRQLERVWQDAPAGSYVRLEAGYLLGKARLQAGDAVHARVPLEEVVRDGGRHAPEAQALLGSS